MGNLGNKKIMAENITYYMNKHQKSRNDMCEALGVKYTTFTDWVKGNSFGISKADLVEKRNSAPAKSGVTINVLGRVAAGIPIDCVEEIIDTEEITQDMASTGEFFGLQIHGDSMEPRMKDGDVVIVRQQDDAETDNIVIAVVNGNEATCKRLKKYAEGIALISTNPSYEPMYFSNKEIAEKPVRIIGVVKELRAKF